MNISEFWTIIDITRKAGGGDASRQADMLVNILVQLPLDEILAYETIMDDLMDKAYDASLWDAADIIGCGCSNDDFSNFRAWLIAQGEEVYEKALVDPESLVDWIETNERARDEDFLYIAMIARERKTGQAPTRADKERPELRGVSWPQETRKERFPKLAAKFGDCDQRESIWDAEDNEPLDDF